MRSKVGIYNTASHFPSNTAQTPLTDAVQVVALTSWQPLAKMPRTFSLYDIAPKESNAA